MALTACIPLHTARTVNPGSFRVCTVSAWGAPKVYVDGLHITYGVKTNYDLTLNTSFLAGVLDEPGLDLELRRGWQRDQLDMCASAGLGYYPVDGGFYANLTQAASKEYKWASPFLIHRLELDAFRWVRGKLYLGAEIFPQWPVRAAVALGSRDLYHRDLFTLAVGLNCYLKGFYKDQK